MTTGTYPMGYFRNKRVLIRMGGKIRKAERAPVISFAVAFVEPAYFLLSWHNMIDVTFLKSKLQQFRD